MTRFTPALAVALAALASNAQSQADYHRADLIRTAPAKLMGVPEDWGRGFGAAIGFARPTWLADSTRFWYSVMTPRGRSSC